ncbi:5-oxoprolinase subunit PxpA [Loigolactobacillus coryniformis]|uniref:LamB/YcsF family protein n=1 Tax=Loigolactobacillus coryniformis TaxID=1610 RepID=UPI00164704A0|nr:5-oxoprolinase subunit PxpA [Loigolactobacillus coryniformis]MBW4803788.1 5-oxoprolinase subunit PxpA [Loigolactobacillus coryniformis subsp. torquens]MBW4806489.1 5-oxoprolinase subunit PxpA [Loigolactobacillus coryniformis subsp. torquens]MDC4185533.1 5-oxoprolinase subunit PxpA [Loigolactobacillus coryniformis]MDN5951151.1 5-oxoprolinase subunit PxpA [Loigolactobacillus coryniformis]MDN5953941.1 5-oxoprolinase subunit PxpA [Loigolactobacillus coryniformis]
MVKIDLNCDLGESFGRYTLGLDAEVLPYVTSANIACGFHAGDPTVMAATVALAEKNQVALGAHPGLPDLVGFGRRKMQITPAQAQADVQYQVGALAAFSKNGKLHHVKPHGALYNMAAQDYELARGICLGIKAVDPTLILVGLANSQLIKAAQDIELPCAQEVFADRNYLADGSLVPRSQPNALITDEQTAVDRTVKMIQTQSVTAIDGQQVALKPDTVCVHGDGAKAVAFVQKIHAALLAADIEVTAL